MRRLGKQEHKYDVRTLMLSHFTLPEIHVPERFDFDKGKMPIPLQPWGNNRYGDCVIAGEANHVLRLERIEQRRTVPVTNEIVIDRYRQLTGCQTAGDANDTGLVVLDAMRDWRNNGFPIKARNYKIAAYGELDPHDGRQLRMASYALHGVHFGLWLPEATQNMGSVWDYQGQTGEAWKPGSWGGHLVYSKAFDHNGFEILTWGEKVHMTNAFVNRYCDEAWAVVDNLDSWRVKQTLDVAALMEALRQVSQHVDR